MKDLYSDELERLEVWRQELRQEIGSIRSDIEEAGWRAELTGEKWDMLREIDDLHSDIEEIREREKIIGTIYSCLTCKD